MKSSSSKNTELILHGNLYKAILYLAVPIVLNSFIQTVYNLTDTYWLGKIGSDPMAAITLVSPVQNIIINVGSGITVAGSVLISQSIGAGKKDNARSMANHLFVCAVVFSVVLSLLCVIFTPAIVGWLGAEGDVFDMAVTYLRIVVSDMIFLFTINIFTSISQAQGNSLLPMLLNLFGIALNMILDPIFMVGLSWGVAGVALATLLSKVPCALVAVCILFFGKRNEVGLNYKGFRFEASKLKQIVKVGLPSAIGGSTMQLGFLLMSRNVMEYGSLAVAAYGIGNKVNGVITLPSNALGSATAIIFGQNTGAGQTDRAVRAYKLTMRISVIFLFVMGMILSRPVISRFMVDLLSDDPVVIGMAADFLSIMAFCCWTNGIHNSTNGLFLGAGHTKVNMFMDIIRLWGFRFLSLYICEEVFMLGVRSIWFSVVISNAVAAFLYLVLYKTGIWKKKI